jgi:hypothetical protein
LTLAACATLVFSAAAHAADNVRYVSSTGDNANACTLAAPCRTLQRGINKTPAGGELRVLNSGDYGTDSIVNRSMTISGNGHTIILANPLTIRNANATVVLRGLVVNGSDASAGASGIHIKSAAAVHIEDCVIHGFPSHGILRSPATSPLFIIGSTVRDNAHTGLATNTGPVTIGNSRFENNGAQGIVVSGTTAIARTNVSGNGTNGIETFAGGITTVAFTTAAHNGQNGYLAGAGSQVNLESSVAHGNGNGLRVDGSGTARISNSVFTANGIGISNGGTVLTRQNNFRYGNTDDASGSAAVPMEGL